VAPAGTIFAQSPVSLASDGQWHFVGPTVSVTISSSSQHVLVQSNATLAATAGSGTIFIAVSDQMTSTQIPPGGAGAPNAPVIGSDLVITPGSTGLLDDGVSWIFTGLTAGQTYQFGFVYSTSATDFQCQSVVTTAIVF
jgi:hypothetical protein